MELLNALTSFQNPIKSLCDSLYFLASESLLIYWLFLEIKCTAYLLYAIVDFLRSSTGPCLGWSAAAQVSHHGTWLHRDSILCLVLLKIFTALMQVMHRGDFHAPHWNT